MFEFSDACDVIPVTGLTGSMLAASMYRAVGAVCGTNDIEYGTPGMAM